MRSLLGKLISLMIDEAQKLLKGTFFSFNFPGLEKKKRENVHISYSYVLNLKSFLSLETSGQNIWH